MSPESRVYGQQPLLHCHSSDLEKKLRIKKFQKFSPAAIFPVSFDIFMSPFTETPENDCRIFHEKIDEKYLTASSLSAKTWPEGRKG